MKKRFFSLLLAAVMGLGLVPMAAAAETGMVSGDLDQPKLTQEEIAQLLKDAPATTPQEVFEVQPSCEAPYAAGKVTDEALQAAADRLNAIRRIAGVPAVTLDPDLCENAQYGAVIQGAHGNLDHYPTQPEGMDDDFYQKAKGASSTSNLSAGRSLVSAVDRLLQDSSGSNLACVGHRRWQLNPLMGKVGFGYATSDTIYYTYVAEKVFDQSGAGCDYDFVAWPASGNFPDVFMAGATPWSISLNPEKYAAPRRDQVTVTLTRDSDGTAWTFSGAESYTAGAKGKFFNVDNVGYGVNNCIIFRPDGVENYEGSYTVSVSGLKTASGETVTGFTYQVEFFDPEAVGTKAPVVISTGVAPEESGTAIANTATVLVDGREVTFQMYALEDADGRTNYVKLRDLADVLDGTGAQFNVAWDGQVNIESGKPYTARNGEEGVTPYTGDQPYAKGNPTTRVDGADLALQSFTLQNGGYTYYQLRDLGQALDFNVCWDGAQGKVVIETDKPYDGKDR